MKRPLHLARNASLRRSLANVILVVYALVMVFSMLSFSRSAGQISERYAKRYCASEGELEKNRILSLVDRELVLSRKLADSPAIKEWVLHEDDPKLRDAAIAELESYRSFLRDKAYFLAMKASGSYYAKTPATQDLVKTTLHDGNSADRWFFEELASDKDYVLNIDHDVFLGETRVWINVLVRDSDGRAIGMAGCGMDLTAFLSALVDHTDPGVTTAIVDSKGVLQAYRDRDLIKRNAEAKQGLAKAYVYSLVTRDVDRLTLRETLAKAEAGGGSPVLSISLLGRKSLCSVSSLPELGWFSLVFVDANRVIGLVDFLPVALVTIFALLSVLVAVVATIDRRVIDPIEKLTKAAGQVAAGSYDIALPEGPSNEIGLLGASFATMTAKVKEYTKGLEHLVDERTRELQTANEELEASRRKIVDSIEYAKLIQDSILPSRAALEAGLAGHFVIQRQRDLVGGDFCFYSAMQDGFCIAVADCTGHGVPGAFMTMMAKAHLDHVVEAMPTAAPSAMLRELDRLVSESLRSELETAHLENGLDIALCLYRRSERALWFCGTGLPLYVWQNGEVSELSGERTHLGFSAERRTKRFADHRIDARNGIKAYLVTDGVLDLPGGQGGVSFGRSRLVALLSEIAALTFAEAETRCSAALATYQASNPQRDDLTFLGFGIDADREL